MPDRTTTQQALHTLFHPRAVAVVGASDDTTKHGYIVLNNVREAGFTGGIYGISRRLKDVDGIPCYPDFASLPEPVDVAFLAIPAEAAVQAVRDCARAGLTAAIVGSAGYAESLEAGGAERQAELARIAAEAGIRIVGPNCNGIYNAHLPLSIGFNTSHAKRQPAGGISIFSHSGALFDAMAGRLRMLGAGLSLFASAGNEADLSVLDYMEYAIGHDPTRVIALLIDSLDDGARFRRLALQAAAAGKHVVALKIGGSEAGAARRGRAFLAHRRRQRRLRRAVRSQRRRHRRLAGRLHDRRCPAGPLRPPPRRPRRHVHLRRRRLAARRSLRRAGGAAGARCRRPRTTASTPPHVLPHRQSAGPGHLRRHAPRRRGPLAAGERPEASVPRWRWCIR